MGKVTIVDYKPRTNSEGENFFALILQGGLEMVQSKTTNKFYATAKTSSVTSTFTEEVCKSMIGQEISGSIQKVESEEYEFVVPDTGEVITLEHRWEYFPEGETALVETKVVEKEPATLADHFASA